MIKSEKSNSAPEPSVIQRRIGSTLFNVNIFFNESAKETLEGKIIRLLKNDLQAMPRDGTMGTLLTGRLPERSSI
jgi:hypothetical protein